MTHPSLVFAQGNGGHEVQNLVKIFDNNRRV